MEHYLIQLLTGLSGAASLFLVASGLSLIFGVTRVVNFAHGSFYMLGAYVAHSAGVHFGFWGGILVGALVVGVVGVLLEIVILRRIYDAPELFQLVATFGIILCIQDVTQFIWGPQDIMGRQAPGMAGSVEILGAAVPQYDLFLIALSPAVLAVLWLVFHRTRWGILVRAATADREMVGGLGVNQAWLFSTVFFLGSALAGLGGAIQLPKGGANLLMDFNVIAAAFVVVVVGGMGSIVGAFVAAVLIGVLNSFSVLLFPSLTFVMMFLVMAVVLVIRPNGLLGRTEKGGHAGLAPAHPPLPQPNRATWIVAGLVLAGLLTLPLVGDDFLLVLAIDILILSLFAVSLHFIMGPGGLVSFGHAAYFGTGAYIAAIAMNYGLKSFELGLIAAPLGAAVLALVFGWFCVRLSGVYFAMLTMALAQIAWAVVYQWGDVTGGDDGLLNVWPSAWAAGRATYYYLTLACCAISIAYLRYALFTPFGYVMRCCRDSPLRAAAIGIAVNRHQWFAFALSGAFAGLAGGLYAFSKGSVFPDEMSIGRSFDALLMVLLGGVQTLAGPVIGAISFTALHDALSRMEFWRLIFGLIIILLSVLFPGGIAGLAQSRVFVFVRRKMQPRLI